MTLAIDWDSAQRIKVSITLNGHATSFALEKSFLALLQQDAGERTIALARLVSEVDAVRPPNVNLSTALRIYALELIKRQRGVNDTDKFN